MEQPITYPSVVNNPTQVTSNVQTPTHAGAETHQLDLLIGVGAILLGWAVVVTWILLFITCIVGGRGLLNAWL